MNGTNASVAFSRKPSHNKRNEVTHKKHQTNKMPTNDLSQTIRPSLSAAPAAPAPTWLGPCAPWYDNRSVRRIDQTRHSMPPPNETDWVAPMYEYIERDDATESSAHIPPRVYNTVIETARTPSRTTFARYGWVHTFDEYDAYAVENPGKYAYELWFGHRGMARASLDARQALIKDAAAYDKTDTLDVYATETDGFAIPDEKMAYDENGRTSPSISPTMAHYSNDDELLFPMELDKVSGDVDIDEGVTEGDEGSIGNVVAFAIPSSPQMLLNCADDDTF